MRSYKPLCVVTSAALVLACGLPPRAATAEASPAETAYHYTEVTTDGETIVYEKGDVSADGLRDIEDVVMTMMHINGQKVLGMGGVFAADVNDDDLVDIEDAVIMLDNINGNKAVVVRPDSPESSETDSSDSSECSDSSQSDSQGPKPDTSEPEPKQLKDLESLVRDQVHGYVGNWSVYVKNLDTGAYMVINDRPVYSASIIKLYAMGDAYEKIEAGKLNKDELSTYLRNMITVSDNNSFNHLVDLIGTADMTSWCREHGYDNTVVAHKLPNYYYDRPYNYGENHTSAVDAGKILEDIYKGELVSKEASEEMFRLLLDQQRRSKIPAGLPWGVTCANKTGETDDFCHDAAIVCSGGANYVITVMVEYRGNAYSCNNKIAEVSQTVYNYFN